MAGVILFSFFQCAPSPIANSAHAAWFETARAKTYQHTMAISATARAGPAQTRARIIQFRARA
jgi:hypothetical protein